MEIGHHVHDADEDAQTDGHGEIDDGEADAEQDAHGKGYESLTADVVVECALHVLHEFLPEWACLLGEDAYPVLGKVFVVEQDEKHI